MERRRWWLVLLSVASLVVLAYAAVFTAFSVSVTPDMERAQRLPGAADPVAGTRALVVPLSDAAQVPTFQNGLGQWGGYNGTLLLVGEPGATFPVSTPNATIARALAYVAPTANGTYVPEELAFVGLPQAVGNATVLGNATVNVTTLAGGKAGFLVKADAQNATNVTFVPADHAIGAIARFDPAPALVSLFAFGAFGFLAPILVIIATHRGAGKRGVAGGVGAGVCPECRAPVDPGAQFCLRCGAWLRGGEPK